MKMQLMNETLRYDITMKLYEKEKKIGTNLFIS